MVEEIGNTLVMLYVKFVLYVAFKERRIPMALVFQIALDAEMIKVSPLPHASVTSLMRRKTPAQMDEGGEEIATDERMRKTARMMENNHFSVPVSLSLVSLKLFKC
ncbi:hypothetical protein FQN60_013534 [Etheostoma spectabile]|uniref:Uncharacterized protein n=1 Tax=Etheostoma spectabile TaxID=54343 RepID=A0A5J5CJ54_9PERO|nr:hypothetical protein FQN60_013534 [Etheostoma spectabile]